MCGDPKHDTRCNTCQCTASDATPTICGSVTEEGYPKELVRFSGDTSSRLCTPCRSGQQENSKNIVSRHRGIEAFSIEASAQSTVDCKRDTCHASKPAVLLSIPRLSSVSLTHYIQCRIQRWLASKNDGGCAETKLIKLRCGVSQ